MAIKCFDQNPNKIAGLWISLLPISPYCGKFKLNFLLFSLKFTTNTLWLSLHGSGLLVLVHLIIQSDIYR